MNQNLGQGAPLFVYNIPSIHQRRPAIPGALGNLDLNREINAGDPLNYEQVRHAKSVATALRGLQESGDPEVTEDMVTISASRAVAVEGAYASSEFSPQNITQALQQINNRLGNMDDHLRDIAIDVRIGLAQTANSRIINRNTRLQAPLDYLPLQKTVPGYGRNRALPLVAVMDANNQQNFHVEYPAGGNASLIGTVPPNFDADIEGYRHLDICKLVAFYNEDFDIIPTDNLTARVKKFRRFLTEF